MSNQPVRVLLVEDDEDDYLITRDLLAESARDRFNLDWASTYETGLAGIQRGTYDIALIDYRLGKHTGIDLVLEARLPVWQMPLILLTGQGSPEVDQQAMQAGAADYLVKGRFDATVLERVIRYALERRRAQAEIREKEARFQMISRATNDAVWDWDIQAQTVWHSEGFAHFGYTAAENQASFEWWYSRVHPDDQARLMASVEAVLKETSREVWSGEYRFRRKDGSWAHIYDRAYVIRDGDGTAVRMVGAMMDISQSKQAEEKIREQAGLLDKAHDAIIVRDLEQHIIYWNKGAERLYGWTAAEACVREPLQLPARDTSPQFQEAIHAVLAKGEWFGELRQQTKDGREIVVSSSRTLVRDEQGRPKAIFAVNTDITARKLLEAQFLRSQRMDSIGALAGGIAHDLNNALAPIVMASEFLKMTCTDAENGRILDTIHDSAKRGAGMVKQILTFARGTEVERGVVQVKHLLREMTNLAQHTFPKAIRIRTDIPADIWQLVGQPTQLHQILLNLCVNARDAMPKGGVLTLAAANVQLDASCADLPAEAHPGPHVLLTVSDTGTGMPPEVRARIFDPFFTTKAPDKGTGLGLSTVRNIVRDHYGFLTVHSEVGQGTTFKIYLPAQVAEVPQVNAAVAAVPMGRGELILVVDDESAIRGVATQTLRAFGYKALDAGDGAQAVAVCANHLNELKLLITDMNMPIMDGPATINAIRAMLPAVKVIAASGSQGLSHRHDPATMDVQAVLNKPFSADMLVRTVHEVLNRKG